MASAPVDGHVNPGLPLAVKLVERGHEVRWYTGRRFQARIEAAGAQYLPMQAGHDISERDVSEVYPERAKLKGIRQLRYDLKHIFVGEALNVLRDLQAITATYPADVTLADFSQLGALWLAELGGPPFAAYGVSIVPANSRDTAPLGPGLAPSATIVGRARNRLLGWLLSNVVFGSSRAYGNEIRAQLGLPPNKANPLETSVLASHLFVQASTCLFEYPRSDLPSHVHYVGPLLPASPPDFVPPTWWDDLRTDKPKVLVTQGTVATQHEDLLVPTLCALAGEDLLVVATTGSSDPEDLRIDRIPANARVERFIPYAQLLPHVDLMVTNGGYGGVQFALAHGVPLVVAGRTEDKPEIGARVAWAGVGVRLKSDRPGEEAVRRAVREVLGDPSYRRIAEEHQAHAREYDAVGTAADLIEELIRTRQPVRWA